MLAVHHSWQCTMRQTSHRHRQRQQGAAASPRDAAAVTPRKPQSREAQVYTGHFHGHVYCHLRALYTDVYTAHEHGRVWAMNTDV